MATLDIFVSFEVDKNRDPRDSFYEQAKLQTQHCIRNCSPREVYPKEEWEREAREAIRGCDVVIVLIGEDTHNAPGVRTEMDMARSFGKPTFQIRPQKRPCAGAAGIGGFMSNARNYVPADREIARNYRPLRQVIDHPGRRIGDHCCILDVRSSDGVQGGVESGDSRSGAPLAVGQQPAADSDRYWAVEGDSPQVHRGGGGGGPGP